jgi:collagenase-like PrtC family protease
MNKPKFSVPYNGDVAIVDYYIEKKKFINDVYFGLPHSILPSGRIMDYGKKPEAYNRELFLALKKLKANNIKCSLVVNQTCEDSQTFSKEKLDHYSKIIDSFARKKMVDGIVLCNPSYVKELKKRFPKLSFTISVNSNINTLYKARYASQMGFDIINLDRDINQDIKLIKKISKSVPSKIKLLVNECCLNECLFRAQHFNLLCHHEKGMEYQDRIPCVNQVSGSPWTILKSSFILPRDLSEYDNYVDTYKLAGRNMPTKLLKYLLDSYFYRREKGDLLGILSSYGLYVWKNNFVKNNDRIPLLRMEDIPRDYRKIVNNCDFNCNSCDYCKKIWKKCLEVY